VDKLNKKTKVYLKTVLIYFSMIIVIKVFFKKSY